MQAFDLYLIGWKIMDPHMLLIIFLGALLGTAVGVLPGLTVIMAISLIVPLTYSMNPIASILLLLGVYCGGNYGGSITACLINIPGTPSAIMTTLDGHPLAKRGKVGLAIGMATIGSFVGGIISVIFLALFSPVLANFALKFKSLEICGVAIFGLSIIAYISPGSTIKAIMAGIFGLLLATIGFDPTLGIARFTFGHSSLLSGIDFISAMIGLFGISEMLLAIEKSKGERDRALIQDKVNRTWDAFKYAIRLKLVLLRSSLVGVLIGIIPGPGGTIASITSYGLQKQISKHSNLMGKGSLEGIAAPENANNACIGGAMVPLLSLGIPGDAVTALMMGAFIIHGIVPGPMLYTTNPTMVSSIFIGLLIANFFVLIIGMTGANFLGKALMIPSQILNGIIIALCVIGTFAVKGSLFDTFIMLIFGVLGYFMAKGKVSKAPVVLGLVLGPIMEENLRRWAVLAEGDFLNAFIKAVFTNPVTLTMFLATLVVLIAPIVSKKKHFSEEDINFSSEESDFDPNEIIFAKKK